MSLKVRCFSPILLLFTCFGLQIGRTNAQLESIIPVKSDWNFTELADLFDVQCEEHEVITEDGYILTLFRLKANGTLQAKPVLVWHGVLDSADTLIARGEKSIPVSLNRAGYDVWLGNSRGNKYSRRHQTLDPDTDVKEFWDFSFHEFGVYDLSAAIDFVLDRTGQDKLSAIGHSQGSSLLYILGSQRPEYNEKVQLGISMAPIAFLNNLRGLLAVLVPLWPTISLTWRLTGNLEILKDESALTDLIQLLCSQGLIGTALCRDGILMAITGYDTEELEPEFFEFLASLYPAGSALKNGDHYEQVVLRRTFGMFDYGTVENLARYGTLNPPDYDLSKVTMPIAILAAENDYFSTLEDVNILRAKLANVVYYKVMEREQFNHINYIVGKNMDVYMIPLIKSLLENFSNNSK